MIALFIAAFLFLPVCPALSVTGRQKTMLLPMQKNERFSIQYTHSANRSPVIDTLEWGGVGLLIIRSSLFQTYGAGIPADGDMPGAKSVITQNGILYMGIDTPHDTIMLITGTIADHHILYRDERIQLKGIFGEAEPIKFSAIRVSYLQLFRFSLENNMQQ